MHFPTFVLNFSVWKEGCVNRVSYTGMAIKVINHNNNTVFFLFFFLQDYMKKLVEEIEKSDPGRVAQFKASAKIGVKKVYA